MENLKLLSIINSDDLKLLSQYEINEINRLINISKNDSIEFFELCKALDCVWDELGCDNQNINWEKLNYFYSHPVWLLNGFFAEKDEASKQNRKSISNWIFSRKTNIKSVLDHGGGFGTIARFIAQQNNDLIVDVYEPYPHKIAILKSEVFYNLNFVSSLIRKYDCLVSTDVLEHVEDPLLTLSQMIESVNVDGYLIIHNHFQSTIKCHLPHTFHLIYTFKFFAKLMGLSIVGSCEGGPANVYKKLVEKPFDWNVIRKFEKISKVLYPFFKLTAQQKKLLFGQFFQKTSC